uniref:DeoR/GlpR family DNA-binding transcription regulator n=1 Tax=Vibrio vulnificus TaxID=672 RepID=UPI001EEC7B85
MTSNERRDAILKHIQQHQSGSVNDFAVKYQVSEVTIRNDLNVLEKKGCVTRCYGGAMINAQFAFDKPLQDKKQINQDIKSLLGQYAASLVEDGDTLILDSGSTKWTTALRSLMTDPSAPTRHDQNAIHIVRYHPPPPP